MQVLPTKATPSSVSSATATTSIRKLAMAVDPREVQRSVSRGSSRRSLSRGAAAARGRRSFSRDPPSTPSRRVQPQFQSQSLIRPSMSRDSTASSAWHDERLQKGHNHSNTFQKRLEEQAAAAIQRAEQKTMMDYEMKLKNSLKSLEAIEKRKKNDLRLIELRKKAEMEKVKDKMVKELFEVEKLALKEEQETLKKQVLNMKGENSELRYNCRKIAADNKQLLAEIESNQKIAHEVGQHNDIVAQLDNINAIFKDAHVQAVQDLRHLEGDCKKETKEKKKIKNWIDSLITLMEHRCKEPRVMQAILKIEKQAKIRRDMVVKLHRKRQVSSSSKRSQRSGTTAVLRKKVQNMRRQAKSEHHILDGRAKLSTTLAARRDQEDRQDRSSARDQGSKRDDRDDEDALKRTERAKKKMNKRRKEIETIVDEMRKLNVNEKDDPPTEIFI